MQQEQYLLHSQLEDHHWWFTGRRRIVVRVLQHYLPPMRERLVIEVGCGTGGNLACLHRHYTCIGIDPSPEAVRLARAKAPTCRIVQGTAPDDLGQWAGQADAFLLLDVLEHVRDDFALLSSIVKVAKTGCLFLITVPAEPALWSPHDIAFGHYRRYDRRRLAHVSQDLPVQTRLFSYYNSRLFPLIHAIRKFNRVRRKSLGRAQTDFSILPGALNNLLDRILSGESGSLLARSTAGKRSAYRRGVSLMCLLERSPGECALITKPAGLRDLYDPDIANNGAA